MGDFNHLGGHQANGVARLLHDGTMDPNFNFQNPELVFDTSLTDSPYGAHVDQEGNLTLLTSLETHGYILKIAPDGTVTHQVLMNDFQSAFHMHAWRYTDGSWIVIAPRLNTGRLWLRRLGADGRLLTELEVFIPMNTSAIQAAFHPPTEKVFVGGKVLPGPHGPWSGILAIPKESMATLRLTLKTSSNKAELHVHGPPRQVTCLEASPDLDTWTSWTNLTLNEAGLGVLDIPEVFLKKKFYRARSFSVE